MNEPQTVRDWVAQMLDKYPFLLTPGADREKAIDEAAAVVEQDIRNRFGETE